MLPAEKEICLDDFFQRMQAVTISPDELVKKHKKKSEGIYLVLEGELMIFEFSVKDEPILVNRYTRGMACGDPEFNFAAHHFTEIRCGPKTGCKAFFISASAFYKVFSLKVESRREWRMKIFK